MSLLTGFSSSQAVGSKAGFWPKTSPVSWPRGHLHRVAYHVAASLPQNKQVSGQDRVSDTKSWSYCNLVFKVTFHHFCHIPLVRSESLGAVCIRGRKLHEGINTRR